MKLLDTDHWSVWYREDLKILWAEWLENAPMMEEYLFKEHLTSFVRLFGLYEINGFLVDSRKGHFVMNLDIQEWHDQEIAPIYVEYELKKIAFVLPGDFFAEMSLEQAFNEKQASQLNTRFFDDLKVALDWIQS